MRALGTLLVLALAVAFAGVPANAEYYANEKKPKDRNVPVYLAFAQEFTPLAKKFGCEFAWANATDPSSVQLEFVPPGQDVRAWTRLFTVNTVALPPKESDRLAVVQRLQGIMMDTYRQRARVVNTSKGTDASGAPTLYVEYDIGDGAATEHNAAAVIKLRADLAGIVQIQTRGKALAREDANKIKALANIKQD